MLDPIHQPSEGSDSKTAASANDHELRVDGPAIVDGALAKRSQRGAPDKARMKNGKICTYSPLSQTRPPVMTPFVGQDPNGSAARDDYNEGQSSEKGKMHEKR
jgi:hypothetical protein